MSVNVDIIFQGVDQFTSVLSNGLNMMNASAKNAGNTVNNQLGNAFANTGKKISQFGLGMAQTGMALETTLGAPIRRQIDQTEKKFVGFEDQIGDVAKAANLNKQQALGLGDSMLKLGRDIPTTTTALNEVALAAGSMNIPLKEMPGFIERATKGSFALGIPTKDLAIQLGQLDKTLGYTDKELDQYLASLNRLENETTANAAQISQFMNRFIPVGNAAKMNANEMAALGATMIEFGVAPTTAARALSMLIPKMQSATQQSGGFKVGMSMAGISAKELESATNRSAKEGIDVLSNALNRLAPEQQAAAMLKLFGQDYIKYLPALIQNTDAFSQNLDRVGDATKNASTYQQEYNTKLSLASSQMQLYDNAVNELQIRIGQALVPAKLALLNALRPLIIATAEFVSQHPRLTAMAAAFLTVMSAIIGIITPLGMFIAGIGNMINFLPVIIARMAIWQTSIFAATSAIYANVAALGRWLIAKLANIPVIGTLITSVASFTMTALGAIPVIGGLAASFAAMAAPILAVVAAVYALIKALQALASIGGGGSKGAGLASAGMDAASPSFLGGGGGSGGGGMDSSFLSGGGSSFGGGYNDNSLNYNPQYEINGSNDIMGDIRAHDRELMDIIGDAQTTASWRQ